ncbi:RNA-binding protein 48 [Stomoxys calcitrans]|uniref:RNA-binding protein 48 n=1 Tax=Stomoxys calcitrans TaxID=35570 RepID=A0A1I8QD72_STOCA|nr:RNA-binding protein 48 [Stomoxys calcitrans]
MDNLLHHNRFQYCTTRLKYRQGKELKAVKVYTVANESKHILVFGVPKINLQNELKQKLRKFGAIKHVRIVTADLLNKGFEIESFTEVFWVCFERVFDARKCKRYMDAKSFYGGILHISYAAEYETIEELREKLELRRTEVDYRVRANAAQYKYMKTGESNVVQ